MTGASISELQCNLANSRDSGDWRRHTGQINHAWASLTLSTRTSLNTDNFKLSAMRNIWHSLRRFFQNSQATPHYKLSLSINPLIYIKDSTDQNEYSFLLPRYNCCILCLLLLLAFQCWCAVGQPLTDLSAVFVYPQYRWKVLLVHTNISTLNTSCSSRSRLSYLHVHPI